MFINVAGKAKNLFNTYRQAESDEAKALALANPLFSWHVTYFPHNHKKNLIFLNDATTMAVVLYDVNAKNKKQIKERFEANLKAIWTKLGLSVTSLTEYLEIGGDWQVNKTINRSKMGSLILLCREVVEPLIGTVDEVKLSETLTTRMQRQENNYIDARETINIINNAQPFKISGVELTEQDDNQSKLREIIKRLETLASRNPDDMSITEVDQTIDDIQKENNELLDIFLTDIQTEYSDKTLKRYKNNLQFYLNEWLAYHLQVFFDFNSADVEELLYHGSSRTEVKNIERALKRLMRYLHAQGVIDDSHYESYLIYLKQGDTTVKDEEDIELHSFSPNDLTFNTTDYDLPTIFDKRTDELIDDYFAAFASLYGIIPVRHAYQIIKIQNPQIDLDEKKYGRYVLNRLDVEGLRYHLVNLNQMAADLLFDDIFEDEIFIVYSTLLADPKRLAELYSHQLGLQYYVPDKTTIMRYKYDDYFGIYELREKLGKILLTNYELADSNMVGAIFIILYGMKLGLYQDLDLASMTENINRIIKMLHDTIGLDIKSDTSDTALLKLLLQIAVNIRRPFDRGWNSAEIIKIPGVAELFDYNNPVLSDELVKAIKQGQVDRQELIYYIEDTNISVSTMNSLRKQIEDL